MDVNDGQASHTLKPTSRYVQALDSMPLEAIQDRLSGGTIMAAKNEVVDMRPSSYDGYVMSDNTFEKMVDVIGVTMGLGKEHRRSTRGSNALNSSFSLGKLWSKSEIEVPCYKQGGDYTSNLMFRWSPFGKYVNTIFSIVRLICTNGMVGTTSLINANVPIENRWEEHLDIAAIQVQNKLSAMVPARFEQMGETPATIQDLWRLVDHAKDRKNNCGEEQMKALNTLLAAIDPVRNLGTIYNDEVLKDAQRCAQLPSHLSQFDAYNICTELSTHHAAAAGSSDLALDKMANDLVFSRVGGAQQIISDSVDSALSDPNKAFWTEAA